MEKVRKNSIGNNTEIAPIQVSAIKDAYENGSLYVNDKYQRNQGVWDKQSESKLILSIFENYPLGEVIRNRKYIDVDGIQEIVHELVDGQQRITTIVKFMNDEISLTDDDSKKIISDFLPYFEKSKHIKNIEKVINKFHNKENISLKYKSLPIQLQDKLKTCSISVRTLETYDDNYILEYFRRVQSGKRLTNEDMVHTVINPLTEKTKEISKNKKVLSLFDFVFENGEEKKDASRKINLCLLETLALNCDKRDIGVPKDLWKWVDEQPNEVIKQSHLDSVLLIKDFFGKINTDNRKLDVGKTEIKLIFSFILFGYNKVSDKLGFNVDDFANFVFNISMISRDIKTYNSKRSVDLEEALIDKLQSVKLLEQYKNNTELFNQFSSLRAGSHGYDEVSEIMTKIVDLY
jgi:DNA-binding transcriptional MerR regulator